MSRSITSNEVELMKESLVGYFYYTNGGRRKVEDNIAGVWVKVMHEGKLVAEYINPSTAAKHGWKTE
jgi:hypothetical protein